MGRPRFIGSDSQLPPPTVKGDEVLIPLCPVFNRNNRDRQLCYLELGGGWFVDQPRVWQNFVIRTLPDDQPDGDECWRIVKEALAKWELHMPERNLVCGSAEHMLLWRLAYE